MKLKSVATLCASLLLAGVAQAQLLQVSQMGSPAVQFQAFHVPGTLSFAQIYNHNAYSYDGLYGLPVIEANTIASFFVESNGQLGFFHVYGKNTTADRQEAVVFMETTVPLSFVVEDDVSATSLDEYLNLGPALFATNGWNTNQLDGFVLAPFTGDWTFTATLLEHSASIESWNVLAFDGTAWQTAKTLDMSYAATFSAVPEPSTIAFAALGGLAAVAIARRRAVKQPTV